MKYDTNLKGHYFVDAEVLPDRGTLKKMIRESYGDSRNDTESSKKTRNAAVLRGIFTFAMVASIAGIVVMAINENLMGVMVLLCVCGLIALLTSIFCNIGILSKEAVISGIICRGIFFLIFVAATVWVMKNRPASADTVQAEIVIEMFRAASVFTMGIPLVLLISRAIGCFAVLKMCNTECNAECIGLDTKLAKDKNSSVYRVLGTPVFSYWYNDREYVAIDNTYVLDYERLPKPGQRCTIYVNPGHPEDMLYNNKAWKVRMLPLVVFSVVWMVTLSFMIPRVMQITEKIRLNAMSSEQNVVLNGENNETGVVDSAQGYDIYAADGRWNLHDVEINQYCINADGEVEEWDIYLRTVTEIVDLGDGTSNLFVTEAEGVMDEICISNTDTRYNCLEVGDEVYWIQKGEQVMLFPVASYVYIGEKTVKGEE